MVKWRLNFTRVEPSQWSKDGATEQGGWRESGGRRAGGDKGDLPHMVREGDGEGGGEGELRRRRKDER